MSWIFPRLVPIVLIIFFLCTGAKGAPAEYYVKDMDGYVTIFSSAGEVIQQSNIRTRLLPSSDRALLSQGIACQDMQELARILENFCS